MTWRRSRINIKIVRLECNKNMVRVLKMPSGAAAGLSQEVENLVAMSDWPKTLDIAVFARRSFYFAQDKSFAEAISSLPNQEMIRWEIPNGRDKDNKNYVSFNH